MKEVQQYSRLRNKASVLSAVERTELVLHRSGVFLSHVPETINTDTFWKNVVRPTVSGTDADRRNESCQLSLHDQNTVAMINNMPTDTEFLTTEEDNDESVGSCSVRSGRTLTGIRHEPDNDLDEGENDDTEGDPAVFDAVDYLKHLGQNEKNTIQ